ncbi:hypothetical protein L2E82_25147 [Cichorium intybus]|uniref:Uncharacterized protein n=1 Tax=Cichorium intybus TaxID=13427 RepID=A0ACB9E3Q7_CICIN|nr:hypothetical protein L2E82_25147 [Cichorium intybus]
MEPIATIVHPTLSNNVDMTFRLTRFIQTKEKIRVTTLVLAIVSIGGIVVAVIAVIAGRSKVLDSLAMATTVKAMLAVG